MKIFLLLVAFVLFITGLAYFYYPKLIVNVNKWMRKIFFDDSRVLYNRKKTGIIYVLVSLLVFYGAYCLRPFSGGNNVRKGLYEAWCHYYQGEYEQAKKLSEHILESDPDNQVAMEQLMLVYFVQNDYKKADYYCKRVLAKNPNDKRTKNLSETIQKKMKSSGQNISDNFILNRIKDIIL